MAGIDLRKELIKILTQYGYNVYLQRATNANSGEELKYKTKLEKHTVRQTFPSSATGAQEEQIEGINFDVDVVFYFQHSVNPASGDRIYERSPNHPKKQIVWLADYALPMRGRNGRIEYWTVGAKKESE